MLTHPADWGAVRVALLVSAAQGLAASVRTMAEPVAAAVQQGASVPEGAVLAVLDVGAGTTDVSVLRAEDGDFQVLATRGDPHFGGADIDEALMDELGARLKGETTPAVGCGGARAGAERSTTTPRVAGRRPRRQGELVAAFLCRRADAGRVAARARNAPRPGATDSAAGDRRGRDAGHGAAGHRRRRRRGELSRRGVSGRWVYAYSPVRHHGAPAPRGLAGLHRSTRDGGREGSVARLDARPSTACGACRRRARIGPRAHRLRRTPFRVSFADPGPQTLVAGGCGRAGGWRLRPCWWPE